MAPHPIGYVEFQRSWIRASDGDVGMQRMDEITAEAAAQYPGYENVMTRIEHSTDGAGVMHTYLYVGFAPKQPTAEPLNPHNLNDAPANNIGDPARDNFIGAKETSFRSKL